MSGERERCGRLMFILPSGQSIFCRGAFQCTRCRRAAASPAPRGSSVTAPRPLPDQRPPLALGLAVMAVLGMAGGCAAWWALRKLEGHG